MAYPTTSNNLPANHASGQTITAANQDAVEADENALTVKVGTGASTPAVGMALSGGVAAGSSVWTMAPHGIPGAVGDGVTDDTAAIQAEIDRNYNAGGGAALEALGDVANQGGGGQTTFLAGRYLISAPLKIYSKSSLMGAGIEATEILLKTGSNCDMIQSYNFASVTGTNTVAGISNFSIQNMTLDGNRTNQTAGTSTGLKVYAMGYILHNFRVRHCSADGIYTEWAYTPQGGGIDGTMEAHWTNIMVHDNGNNGIVWAGPHDSEWAVGTVHSNNKNANGSRGVYVKHTAAMSGGGLTVSDVHVWGSHDYAWDFEDTVRVSNCMAEGALISQIRFGSGGSDSLKASESVWIGGDIFSGPGLGQTAVEIGGPGPTGFAPVSIFLQARAENFTSGQLVKFTVPSAGGHCLKFVAYLTSSAVYTGTAAASDYIEAVISGGGGPAPLIKMPTSPTVPNGEGIKSALTTDQINLRPGNTVAFGAAGRTNAVNYQVANPATAGNGVNFYAAGTDTTIDHAIIGKGMTSRIALRSDFSASETLIAAGVISAVNYLQVNNAATGAEVAVTAQGADTNINLLIQGKGTGLIHFGQNGIALGGGAAPTFGTIGGSGPTGAAQSGWMKFRDNNDGDIYFPYWK